jgi:hypothetical protein
MNFGKDKPADKSKRHFTHGASGATADVAAQGKVRPEDRHINAPSTRKTKPLNPGEKHDQLAEKEAGAEDRQEALLDEGIEETFPASDPVSAKRIT